MKTLALIIVTLLAFTGIASAATDGERLVKALSHAQASVETTQKDLDAVTAQRDLYGKTLDKAADISQQKDAVIAAKTAENDKLIQAAANDKKTRIGLISGSLGVPGGLLIAAGVAAAVILGLYAVGVKLGAAGMFLVAEGIAVATHAEEIGLIGLWLMAAAAGVAMLGVAVWVANDVRRHRDAGVEIATVVPLAKASGKFAAEQIEWLEHTAYIEGSKLADKLRAAGEGIRLKDLIKRVRSIISRGNPAA